MTPAEFRQSTAEELRTRLGELVEENFNLRFQHALGQLASPIRLREVRRDIGRVKTILQEHDSGLREVPEAKQ